MQYFGGKARIAKELSAFINSKLQVNQPFVDIFCGSCNVISKVDSNRILIANDIHTGLIALHMHVQAGLYLPSHITNEQYEAIKTDTQAPSWLKGFVGFGCGFSGTWWGGYARGGEDRNYCLNAKNSLIKKHKTLRGVKFSSSSYIDCLLPEKSFIYCDIPYKNTAKYSCGDFDHDAFYSWVSNRRKEGHTVFISEYEHNIPDGFNVHLRIDSKKGIRNSKGEQARTTEVLISLVAKDVA